MVRVRIALQRSIEARRSMVEPLPRQGEQFLGLG